MNQASNPIGNASGNAPNGRYGPGTQPRVCQACGTEYRSARPRSYCSPTCRQRAFRARHAAPVPTVPKRRHVTLDVLYECGQCGEQYLNERRCESCNLFCARIGAVLPCPHCNEPIPLTDLFQALGQEVPDRL